MPLDVHIWIILSRFLGRGNHKCAFSDHFLTRRVWMISR
jgi:hypothetical protein